MVVDYTLIGQRVKAVRKKKKYTQERLAESLDVSIVYISQIENARTKLSLEMLIKIASLLDTDPGFFLVGSSLKIPDSIPHEIAVILQNSPPKKLKLITEILKSIDKY